MSSETYSLLRLRVAADADPCAIPVVLGRFQNLNIVPRRVVAEFGMNVLHIEVDVCGLSEGQLTLIAGKVRESPCIRNSHWHKL